MRAVIVVRDDLDVSDCPTDDELRDFCAAAIAYYKVPTEWVLRSEPLPRNAMGKVIRDALDGSADASRVFVEE